MSVSSAPQFSFDNSYARLPERFFAALPPTAVAKPGLVRVNEGLARELGLDPRWLMSDDGVEMLAGNMIPDGAEPIAMAYAGHQFGNWVPQLGDGRAILLGEVVGRDGTRRDVQLKGAGRTPFSRAGDGRAVLGPVLREYIVGEAMTALGIPSTRALAAVTTGEAVMRERPMPGAILTRVATGHVRVGTFEFFAVRRDTEALRQLADYVIERHYPDAAKSDTPYLQLLDAVIARQAALVARWMQVGFIHGVMNTDNMSIAGETIDYGPCAYMDDYHPQRVYSSIDHMGRYAYGNQPRIAHWNLVCLAQSLLPLLGEAEEKAIEAAQARINTYPERFEAAWLGGMRAKLGLEAENDGDLKLAQDLLDIMAAGKADFTLTFRRLANLAGATAKADEAFRALFENADDLDPWLARWRERLTAEARGDDARQAAMRAVNPAFIPRNHRVEQAIVAAYQGDYQPFETLNQVLSTPFDDQPEHADLMLPPKPGEVVQQTFCGT